MSHSHTRPPLSVTTHEYSLNHSDNSSPLYTALDSSAALVLIHDDDSPEHYNDVERPLNLDFSTDDDDDDTDDLEDSLSPLYQLNGRLTIPPLPPSTLFLYLLSPYLKLGALLLPYYQLPLAYGLSGLFLSALLALVSRHLLYLLARYLRKADLEDVVTDSFVSSRKRGRGTERRRSFFRFTVRLGTATLRILVAALYLRECVHYARPIFTSDYTSDYPLSEVGLALVAVALAMLLSYPKSLASRLVIYTTYFSVLAYFLWFVTIIFLYTNGSFASNTAREISSNLWAGLATTAFVFTSSNTLPLYASAKGTIQPLLFNTNGALSSASPRRVGRNGHDKEPLYRSFKFLSLLSIIMATALMTPLVVFAAFPKGSGNTDRSTTMPDRWNTTTVYSTQTVSPVTIPNIIPIYTRRDEPTTPVTRIQNYIVPTLASLTLLFGTPQLLITIPPFPKNSLNFLRSNPFHPQRNIISSSSSPFQFLPNWIKRSSATILITISLLTLTLLSVLSHGDILSPITILTSILATYYVPSFLHTLTHTFKSPLSIVLPTNTYFSSSSSSLSPRGTSTAILPTYVDGAPHIPDTEAGTVINLGGVGEASPTSTMDPNQELSLPPPPPSNVNVVPDPNPTTSQQIRPSHSDSPSHLYSPPQDQNYTPENDPDNAHDVLLQRKERALQRRQLRRRIIWDIWAWIVTTGGLVVLGISAHTL